MVSNLDYKKWFTYYELHSQNDKFLEAVREMRHCDWSIHKKLKEVNRVYIIPARGQNKMSQLELYATLMNEGRDVKIIRANDIPKLDKNSWSMRALALLEQEQRAERFGHWVHEMYKDYNMRNLKNNYKFMILPEAYNAKDESNVFESDMWLKRNPYLTGGVSEG